VLVAIEATFKPGTEQKLQLMCSNYSAFLEEHMRKSFVAPLLRQESTLAQLTLTPAVTQTPPP